MTTVAASGPVDAGPPRLLLVLAGLYLAQAIPVSLFLTAMPPILRQEGVTRTALGYLGLLAIPGVLKFLWAPLVDRMRPIARAHRGGWIVLTQAGVVLAVLALLLIRPGDLLGFIPIAFAIAMLVSTQDIATDGYATLALPPGRRAAGNAVQSGAAAAGVVLGGSLGLILYHQLGWSGMILGMAGLCLLPLAAVPAMREHRGTEDSAPRPRPRIMAFLQRPEARHILWIALLFRAGEGLVKPMEAPYLVDAHVGLDAIAALAGASAAVAGVAGTALLAWLLQRRGPAVALGLIGTLRVLACLVFALHAAGLLPGLPLLFGAAALQTLIRYTELVVLFSLFMAVASPTQPGTDFTMLACAQYAAYLLGSVLSGTLADRFGYAWLFGLGTALSVVVLAGSLALLLGRGRAERA
ncbi:MFS transporter (putative signal transducer) [Inquilinus ginsengisoli]|uniref:MFS transporter n=1 Tax=Inquilinus ginsengisoli TaxID=363840 RepID=UPI003D1A81BC